MANQDLDALFMGALYGELSPEDKARLDAQLAANADHRAAFEALTHTRGKIQSAKADFEPSPAISALLMREAARRVPAKASGGGVMGWLGTVFRPVMAHPAIAAAAALVVVGGTVGLMELRGGGRYEATAPGTSQVAQTKPAMAAAPPTAGAAPEGAIAADEGKVGAAAPPNDASAPARRDTYEAKLADEYDHSAARPKSKSAAAGRGDAKALDGAAFSDDAPNAELAKKADRAERGPAKPTSQADLGADKGGRKNEGLVTLTTAEPQLKELESVPSAPPPDAVILDQRARNVVAPATGGAATSSKPKAPPKAPAESAPRPAPESQGFAAPPPSAASLDSDSSDGERPLRAGGGGGGVPAVSPAPKQAQGTVNAKDIEWARQQHSRALAAAKKNACGEAARLALAISQRTPDYYVQAVANDRNLNSCRAAIDQLRQREVESRKTRAMPADTANQPASEKR